MSMLKISIYMCKQAFHSDAISTLLQKAEWFVAIVLEPRVGGDQSCAKHYNLRLENQLLIWP